MTGRIAITQINQLPFPWMKPVLLFHVRRFFVYVFFTPCYTSGAILQQSDVQGCSPLSGLGHDLCTVLYAFTNHKHEKYCNGEESLGLDVLWEAIRRG